MDYALLTANAYLSFDANKMNQSTLTLRERLLAHVNTANRPLHPREIYPHFTDAKQSTLRAELALLAIRGDIARTGGSHSPYISRQARERADAETAELTGNTTYPVAPNGYGAAQAGRANDAGVSITLPDAFVQQLTGGVAPSAGEAFWTFAAGPSALPFIKSGDPIFVQRTTDFVDGERYAVWLGDADEDVIKRVEVCGTDCVRLRSDNTAVRTRTFRKTDEDDIWTDDEGASVRLVVQGRVVWPSDSARAAAGLVMDALSVLATLIKAPSE